MDPVTDASGFPYRPSFNGGLGRCTGAISCGRRHLPLRVGGRHARVPCVCACARPSWPGRAGRPPGRVLVRLTFSLCCLVFLLCWAPSGQGLPPLWFFGFPPPPFFCFFFLLAFRFWRPPCLFVSLVSGPWCLGPWRLVFFFSFLPPCVFFFLWCPRCLPLSLVSGPGCPGPWRCVLFVLLASRSPALRALSPLLWFPPGRWLLLGGCCPPPPPPFCDWLFFRCRFVLRFFFPFRAPVVSGFLWFPAPGVLGLGAACCLFCWPPAPRLSARSRLFRGSCLAGCCSSVVAAPPPPPLPPLPFVPCCFSRRRFALRFFLSVFFSRCAPPLSLAFLGFRPRVPWALALCAVCFVGLRPLGSPCALASFVVLAWPLAAPWWFLPSPPPSLLCLAVFLAASLCSVFFSSVSRPRVVFGFLWFPAPGALGLGAVCCLFCWPPAPRLAVRSRLFCGFFPAVDYSLVVAAPPPPPPFCVSLFFSLPLCAPFFFPFRAPVVSGFLWFPAPDGLGLGAVGLFCRPPASRLSVCSRLFCVSRLAVGCFVVFAAPPPPPPPFVSRGFRRCRSVPFFFLRRFSPPAPPPPPPWCVRRALCCLVLPQCAALPFCVLCCGASPCCAVGCCVLCGVCWGVCFCVVLRCWLLLRVVPCLSSCRPVGLFAVWLAAWFWSALPCVVLCCVSLGAVLRRAAARRASRCCVVVCCVVLLRLFGVAVCCAVSSGAARRPGALCFVALCFAVFCRAVCSVLCVFCRGVLVRAVVRRCAACCVCPGVSRCAFPVLFGLCGAVFRCVRALASCCSCRACCCWRLVLWCAAVCCAVSFGVLWCGAGSGGLWSSAGCVFWCRCPCLAAWSGSLWLVRFAVVPCFPVSCSVVLCCLVVLCCCVLLPFRGAVCACFALLWPVVPCCAVLLVVCAVWCPVVASVCFGALSLPAGTVFRF